MMKIFAKKQRMGEHYFRYLLSYMMVLLIPLVILTFFYSSRFMKKFYAEIYETVDLELVQVSAQLDNEMESMQGIINQLLVTDAIHQASRSSYPIDLSSTMIALSGFTASNPFIEDIVLILEDNDYIITSTTTCQKDFFYHYFFQAATPNTEQFLQTLQNSTSPIWIPQQKLQTPKSSFAPEDSVLFSYPLFTDYNIRRGTALFYIKNSSIQELLNKKLQSYQAQFYITDPTGTVITTSGSHDVMRPFLTENLEGLVSSSNAVVIEQEEYIIRTYKSKVSQWSFTAFIPNKQTTFSQVSDVMREFIVAIIIIIVLSSLAIFFLQKVNYAPVRRLRDRAKQISPTGTSSDELTTISNALDYLSQQNSSLSSKLESSLSAVKNERLYRLLGGDYSTNEDFNLDCSELNLNLEYSYFNVGILMLHTAVLDLDALSQEIKRHLNVPYLYYYLHYLHPNQITLLLNLPENTVRIDKIYQEVQTYLTKKHHILTTIGMGSIIDSTDHIAQSYMEADSALDYRFVKGNGTLIEFREVLGSDQTAVVYPNQEFEALRNAFSSQKEKRIRTAITNVIQFMQQKQLPLYLARSICFDLIHLVNEHSQNRKKTTFNSPIELSGMETAQEIIAMLCSWSENLVDFSSTPSTRAALEDVLCFLDDNCLRCDFSVYEAALYFDMTLPGFSKYFKDSYGQNVMDYTIHKRMEKARYLLENTNLPLKNISEQVGYYNISSFIRRFKLSQGVTPSDYRKIIHNQMTQSFPEILP